MSETEDTRSYTNNGKTTKKGLVISQPSNVALSCRIDKGKHQAVFQQ